MVRGILSNTTLDLLLVNVAKLSLNLGMNVASPTNSLLSSRVRDSSGTISAPRTRNTPSYSSISIACEVFPEVGGPIRIKAFLCDKSTSFASFFIDSLSPKKLLKEISEML